MNILYIHVYIIYILYINLIHIYSNVHVYIYISILYIYNYIHIDTCAGMLITLPTTPSVRIPDHFRMHAHKTIPFSRRYLYTVGVCVRIIVRTLQEDRVTGISIYAHTRSFNLSTNREYVCI